MLCILNLVVAYCGTHHENFYPSFLHYFSYEGGVVGSWHDLSAQSSVGRYSGHGRGKSGLCGVEGKPLLAVCRMCCLPGRRGSPGLRCLAGELAGTPRPAPPDRDGPSVGLRLAAAGDLESKQIESFVVISAMRRGTKAIFNDEEERSGTQHDLEVSVASGRAYGVGYV